MSVRYSDERLKTSARLRAILLAAIEHVTLHITDATQASVTRAKQFRPQFEKHVDSKWWGVQVGASLPQPEDPPGLEKATEPAGRPMDLDDSGSESPSGSSEEDHECDAIQVAAELDEGKGVAEELKEDEALQFLIARGASGQDVSTRIHVKADEGISGGVLPLCRDSKFTHEPRVVRGLAAAIAENMLLCKDCRKRLSATQSVLCAQLFV